MTLAERIAAELHRVSTDRYMFGLFGDGRMGSGGFGKLQILGKTKHVTRCQNCGRAGLKHAVVCAVVGEDGHPTNQYYYFGTDCAARLAGKAEKDVEAEAEHQESSGRPRMKNLKPAKPNDGQMELGLRFAAYLHDLMTERYARAKASKGQMGFDFDSLASAPQAPAPAAAPAKPAVSEPPALPVKGKQMGLFDQPEQPKTVASGNATNWDAMSLADKLAWQKSNGKTRPDGTAAPAITKPQATPKVNLSGAVYEFVGHNENGTIRVRNDQGDEFDSEPGEQWKQHGEYPVPSSPAKAGGWNEEKHPRWEAGDKQHHGGQFAPKEHKSEGATENPPFRDFRYVPKHRNAGSLYPNRPGQVFTDEQQQQLKNWARQNGMMVSSDSGPGAIHVVHNDHRARLDLTLHGAEGVKREAAEAKSKQAAEQESARKQQAEADLAGREAAGFINEAFGDSLNTYNKTKLADFLEGKDKKFGGLWSRAHAESLQKLGAIDSTGQVNFDAIRKAFEQHGKAATASGPQEPAKPDLQAIAAEARAAGGNLWVTAKKHGIGITHPQASELAKVFQGMGEAEKPQPGPGQLRGQAKFAETRAQEEPKAEPSHLQALRGLVGDEHYNKIAGEFDRAFKEFDTLPQDKKDLEYRANQTRSKALQTELGAKVTYAGLRVGLLGDGMEKLVRGMKQGEQKPELPAQPKAAEPAAPSQPAAPASNPQYQWGPDVVSVEPGNTAPHQKRAEGMAYALAEGVYAAKTGTVHAGNTPEALRKRITQIDAINDAISKAGGTPHAYNKAGVLAEIDKLEAGAGNPSGVQMAQYIPPTRGEQVSGIFNPQPAQSMPAASGGAVAPESQPAESVGSRVAAAITKRSMDFGRKVEVRKDRAKSTGPKAKKQVGEWDLDEGWAKRYQITQVASSKDPSEVGKFIITDKKQKGPWYAKDQGVQVGGQYSSAEEAKQALPLIEVARNHRVYEGRDGKWHIYRKLGDRHHVSVKSFPSQEEAMKYMAMNPREIIGHKFPRYETYQYLTEVERKGPERRKGTVNEQDFQKAFAPGGAVFGNWMTNKDGVTAFHHAYDSLHDLADVLDLHPHQVSIDGDLVFGFGAAGSGGKDAARAHYEPGQRLINLTKMAGAGSLAHEWWHALEHHIAKKLGASEHTAVNLRPSAMKNDPELAAAVEELHDAMHYSNDEGANKAELQRVAEAQERRKQKLADTNREARENGTTVYDPQGPEDFLHNIRLGMQRTLSYKKKEAKPELMKQYEEIESKLKAGDLGERAGSTTHGFVPIYANIQALSDLHKKITGRGLLAKDAEGDKWLRRIYWDNLKLEKPKTEAAKVENKPKRTVRSKFKIEADKLDHSRSSPYYGLPHEMAARAFEAYVEDKLKEKGIQSDYLVGQGKTDSDFYKAFGLDAPFPEGDERKQINAAFDKLLAAVRKHLRKPETERHSLVESAEQLNRRVRQLVVEKFGANELVPEQPKPQQPTAAPALAGQVDSHPHWETPEFKNWFGGSHVKTPEGKPLRVFHGTKRPDRIQNFFNPKRATSGPMAFFTDNPEIASSYATSKQDTSLEMPESYSQWFKYKVPGSKREVDLDSAWYHLPAEQRKNALERLPHVNTNEDGVISHQHGQGTVASDWDWYLKREGGGNPLKAARHLWLDSGHLYSDESRFLEVLKHAGIDHTQFRMESPWHEQPGVYPVHLSIQNPLDTGNIPEHVHNALQQAGKRKRGSAGGGADQWDKRHVSGPDWLQRLAEDRQNGTAHAWTSIPDWVTKTLMAHGYDGIKDSGGKGGGTPHNVWIPFRSHQVKSAIGNRGSYSLDNKRINHSAESAVERYSAAHGFEELLARAAKYRVKGQGYNRNIHTSASRLDDMLSQGRHKEAAHWADELRLRLDALEPKPATDLLGQPVKPAPKPKAVFDSSKGKQQTLFAGLNAKEGQMNLFADAGVPDDLVAKPQKPAQKELFSAIRDALVERYEQAGDRQPKFRIDAGMKAAAQPTPPSTKPPAIFGAIGGLASKAGNWLQDKADKVAGKIGGAAQKLDQKGQAAMAKVGLADKAAAPAKPKSAGVKAGAPLMFNGDHLINGGQTSIPKGTQGKLVGPHQDPKNVVVDVGGQHHVVPKSLLLHDLRHTDHKAVEKSKQEAQQAQADQQAKVRQMTARQRAEAVPEGADKAKLKNMNIGSHELQVGDVVNHSTPGLHPYGRVLEVSPDGKKIKIEEAARSKNAPGGIATTGRHVWIDGHEKIGDTGAVGTRSFPVLRTPDEYRPIGERKEYKEAYEGAKKLGLNDDQAHEMAMQMWDDLQAKNNPKPQPAPAAQQPAQAQPQAAQAKPAGAPKPRHHAESLQAGDTLRMLEGSDTGTNLKFIGRSKQPGMVEVEHPTLGRQTFRSRDLGLYVPGSPKAAGPSFTDQMKKGYDRSSPDMHTVKRSEFAGQKHGVLAKDQQGRGFLLYGGKKYALSPNEFDGKKLIGDNPGVKIRERIHREQIQALASKDPSAVPAHVREEYDHHWDKWSGNSSFAKSGGKPAKGPAQVPQEPKRAATLIGMPLNTPAGKAGVGRLTPVEQRSPLEDPALQEQIQERAAIMEHEGGYDPQSALRLAIRDAARRFKPSQPLPQVSADAQPARADSRIQPGQKASNPARLEGQKAALNRSLLEDAGQAQQPKAIFLGRDQFRNALQSPPSRVRTGTPAQPPAPIDEEAAERAAIQAEGNQITPEGQAASPPPTQPAGAASAPSGVNPPAAKPQSPNLRALIRPFQAGRNMAVMQFADELQRDLHDYAAAQGRRRQFSGKAGRQQPRQAAQLESTLNRIAAEHFGGDKDAAHLAALQTLQHVKAHMRGVGDGQHKIIPPTSAGLPAEPQQPATATATNTGRLTKLPKNPTPRQAEQHVNTMVNRHMREFAAQEAMHAQKLVNAWKVYREKMGIPSNRSFKGSRELEQALAKGADSEGAGLKNFDVWADQIHKDFPWAFSAPDGSKDDSAIFDFIANPAPAIPKASDPELQDKFWASVTPEYKKHLEMMRMGEVPLEHLDLSQQMGDDMRDWEAHRRANDNFSAFQDALVERFSVFWQSSGGMNGRQAGKQRNPSLTV